MEECDAVGEVDAEIAEEESGDVDLQSQTNI
jgi:hypothetical protein